MVKSIKHLEYKKNKSDFKDNVSIFLLTCVLSYKYEEYSVENYIL